MSESPSPIPAPRPDDDEDVHWALSTASALWARGDAAESIKWLRRAAETASDQNRDKRSLELFKAAADATSQLDLTRPPPQTAPLPAPAPRLPQPPPPVAPAARPGTGPTGTLSMQIPTAPASPGLPPVRASAPMPAPAASPAGRASAPSPQRTSTPGGPPAGTARAAAQQANASRSAPPPPPSPGFTPQRPNAAPLPAAVAQARGLLKQTLPSESGASPAVSAQAPMPAARPSPVTGAGPGAPSSAAKRTDSRKRPLDERFHFPDEEVTVQRDLAALKRPRPIDIASGEEAAAAAATLRAPPAAPGPPIARTIVSGVTPRGPAPANQAPAAARTPSSPAPARQHAIPSDATIAEPSDAEHTPIDDLDEQTSVLVGDEPELDFAGSATGESSSLASGAPDHGASDEGVTGEESSDPRGLVLAAPSVRPDPMPRPAAVQLETSQRGANAWMALRVAVRRDAGGVRIEAIARDADTPPGAISALLVAQDDETASALARLLES